MFAFRVIRDASFKKWSNIGPRPTLRVKLYVRIRFHTLLIYRRTLVDICTVNYPQYIAFIITRLIARFLSPETEPRGAMHCIAFFVTLYGG